MIGDSTTDTATIMTSKRTKEYQIEQYKICQARGHKASYFLTTNVTVGICKFCGTHFWDEITKRETNVPKLSGDEL